MKIFHVIIASLVLLSCRNNNQVTGNSGNAADAEVTTATTPSAATTTTTTGKDNNNVVNISDSAKISGDGNLCRLMISFYSIGQGSEYKLIAELEDTIASYSQRTGKKIDFVKTSWGREGEKDFSFKLTELSVKEQSDFVSQVKEITKKGKWVHLYENYPCSTRGRK